MNRRIATFGLVVAMAACAQPGGINVATSDSAEVMAASLKQLVTVDNTFGEGSTPFSLLLVQDHTDPSAGSPDQKKTNLSRELTPTEMEAIEGAIDAYGTVQWIDDPAEWYSDDLQPVEPNSAILGVGSPTFEGNTALVPISLWCGGLCGTWFTYRLDRVDGIWRITGIEGPVAIS
jgi:hypothetical protein